MKKSFQILMVLIATMLFTISCNKEDILKRKIVGEWQVEEGFFQFAGSGSLPVGSIVTFASENIFYITSDNTFSSYSNEGLAGSYRISGDVLYTELSNVRQCSIKFIGNDVLELYFKSFMGSPEGICKLRRVKK